MAGRCILCPHVTLNDPNEFHTIKFTDFNFGKKTIVSVFSINTLNSGIDIGEKKDNMAHPYS